MTFYDEGRYTCRLTTHGIDKLNSEKATPYVFISFYPIVDGEDGQYERSVKLWLTEKTVKRTIETLRDLGWEGDRFADLPKHSFAGKQVEIECTHNGQYEDWDFPFVQPARAVQADEAVAKKLDALFGKQLKATAAVAAPAAAEDDIGQVGEDDIPF